MESKVDLAVAKYDDESNLDDQVEYFNEEFKIPKVLHQRYKVTNMLGKGAHGRIFIAKDMVSNQKIAIKMVSKFFIFILIII